MIGPLHRTPPSFQTTPAQQLCHTTQELREVGRCIVKKCLCSCFDETTLTFPDREVPLQAAACRQSVVNYASV
mgnify:CR=1 FL=1